MERADTAVIDTSGVPIRSCFAKSVVPNPLASTKKSALTEIEGARVQSTRHLPSLVHRAVARLPAASVAIAGRGKQEEPLRRLAHELGFAERVHLLGLRDDVDTILTAADIFAQPSLSEGLPLAVLEAMSFGLPVIATRVGGIPEAVVDGETGYLVPPGDPETLAAALTRVIESADRGASMGSAGRERAAAEFSVERMTDAYRQLYHELRGRRP